MNIRLDKLALGKWRYLSDAELSALMENIADSTKVESKGKPAARKHKGTANTAAPPKPGVAAKGRERTGKDGKDKGKSFATKEGRPPKGKKEAKSWKGKNPAQKSAHGRPGKKTHKENDAGKKGKNQPAKEGSFKNYRNKGRRK
jgi:23S rRNA pseudouridine2604 synthase